MSELKKHYDAITASAYSVSFFTGLGAPTTSIKSG